MSDDTKKKVEAAVAQAQAVEQVDLDLKRKLRDLARAITAADGAGGYHLRWDEDSGVWYFEKSIAALLHGSVTGKSTGYQHWIAMDDLEEPPG